MSNYSDPTASAALGSVQREYEAKKKFARKLKSLYRQGLLSDEYLRTVSRWYRGVYAHLYDEIFQK